ncbi:phosphopantetheine-binding protein [Streptosporangium sp. NPDC051023]|uniref:phosphopantetheine-binding protein n=1 Tax=Streptosporangium sp. NPDC051023 TaxID=3155410 RepID=UPI00344FBB0F
MSHVDTIKQFVIKEFLPDVGLDELDADYDLLAGGVVDSLGLLKLIAWIEGTFDLAVGDTDLDPENFRTVAAIDSFVEGASAPKTVGI